MPSVSLKINIQESFRKVEVEKLKNVKCFLINEKAGRSKVKEVFWVTLNRVQHLICFRVWLNKKKFIKLSIEKVRGYKELLALAGLNRTVDETSKGIQVEINHLKNAFYETSLQAKISTILDFAKASEARKTTSDPYLSQDEIEIDVKNQEKEFQLFRGEIFKEFEPPKNIENYSVHFQNHLQELWKKFSPHIKSHSSRDRLKKIILSHLMRNKSQVMHSFANMHADALLAKKSFLKKFEGGEKQLTGSYFLYFLRLCALPSHGPIVQKFEEAIINYQQWALEYRKQANSPLEEAVIVEKEVEEHLRGIKALTVGESYILLANWYTKKSAHAVAYLIRKEADGTYSWTTVNTGATSQEFHENIVDPLTKKKKINPYYTLNKIQPEILLNPILFKKWVSYTQCFLKLFEFRDIYEKDLLSLEGQKEIKKLTPQDYATPQRSGSCAWGIYIALLRYFVPFKEYKDLIFRMKAKSLLHFYDLFKDDLFKNKDAEQLLRIGMAEYKHRQQKPYYKGRNDLHEPYKEGLNEIDLSLKSENLFSNE